MPGYHHLRRGKTGEDLACRELRRRGYVILDRRYRTRVGELDIIARDKRTLVFVEVKTRSSARYGHPFEAVTSIKQRKLVAMAQDYLGKTGQWGESYRFDLAAVVVSVAGRAHVEVVRNAFLASGLVGG